MATFWLSRTGAEISGELGKTNRMKVSSAPLDIFLRTTSMWVVLVRKREWSLPAPAPSMLGMKRLNDPPKSSTRIRLLPGTPPPAAEEPSAEIHR